MKFVNLNSFLLLVSAIFVTQVLSDTSHNMQRIVGGTVPAAPLPYLVSIYRTISGHICGGALISRQTVLTAASCFAENQITEPAQFGVLVDSITGNNNTGVTRSIYSITVHPDYIESIRSSDIALVTLKTPFEDVATITPIGLPNNRVAVGTACSISGWGGRYFYEHFSGELRTLAVSIVDSETTCVLQYNPSPLDFDVLADSQLCASAANPTHTVCTSDLGGPLVCNNLVSGVLTWGNGCGVPAPGVYTNVLLFNSWIMSTMQAQEIKAASSDIHIAAPTLLVFSIYWLSKYLS